MKKAIIFGLLMLFVGLSTAALATEYPTSAYGTTSFDVGTSSSLTVRTSKNVYMRVSTAGSAPLVFNYSVFSYHSAGSRTFGTSNADQKLFFLEQTSASIITAPTTAGEAPNWANASWQVL